jgi:hypothetical protein
LEVKDWALATLAHADHDKVELNTDQGRVIHGNPLRQARDYAMELVDVLKRDPALIHQEGPFKGHLLFPYGWGVAFSNIRHEQIAGTDFVSVFNAGKTLLRDDLDDAVESAEFQKRLWSMFTVAYPYTLTLPQRDRVRWHLFPDLRMPVQRKTVFKPMQAPWSCLTSPR